MTVEPLPIIQFFQFSLSEPEMIDMIQFLCVAWDGQYNGFATVNKGLGYPDIPELIYPFTILQGLHKEVGRFFPKNFSLFDYHFTQAAADEHTKGQL